MKAIIAALGPVALAVTLSSCGPTAKQAPPPTYSPEMFTLANEQIHDAMVSLANGLMIIEAAKDDPYPTVMIVDALRDMRRATVSLAHPTTRAAKPPIDANMGRLLRDIDAALADSTQNPPQHARAMALADSCQYCHPQSVAVSK